MLDLGWMSSLPTCPRSVLGLPPRSQLSLFHCDCECQALRVDRLVLCGGACC